MSIVTVQELVPLAELTVIHDLSALTLQVRVPPPAFDIEIDRDAISPALTVPKLKKSGSGDTCIIGAGADVGVGVCVNEVGVGVGVNEWGGFIDGV